jgi:hypothetical protein
MAINTTLYQTSPYFDDYETSGNEAKGHLKVLFKPGTSVQARELNQLQTLLQTQIDRFGSHIFENGNRVLNGELTVDGNLFFIDITFSDTDLVVNGSSVTAADVLTRVGEIKNIDNLIGNNSPETIGLSAEIIDYEALVANDTETTYRLYLKYTKKTESRISFAKNQSIRTQTAISGTGYSINLSDTIGTVSKVSYSTKLHINKGVYFISGYFVNVENTDVIVERSAEDKRITGQLAFKISETLKTSVDDSSLLDNATGVPNASAPGADRYAITLSLVVLSDQNELLDMPYNDQKVYNLTTSSSTNFIPLVSLENGKQIKSLSAKYLLGGESKIGNTLARRTLEESGNYCLDRIIISTREAYNDGGNNGKFTATSTSDINQLKSQYVVDVNPGVIYVEGQRIETQNQFSVSQDKARDQQFDESISLNSGVGTYIVGKFSDATIPDIESDNSPVSSYTVNGASPETTITPTGLEKVRGTGLNTVYKLYFNLGTGSYKDVNASTSIVDATVSPQAEFTPIGSGTTFTVRGNKQSSKVIRLPKKLVSGVRSNSTEFVVRKEFDGTSGSAGDYYIDVSSVGSNSIVLKGLASTQTFSSTNVNDYIVSNGATFATVTAVSLNAASTLATLTVNVTSGTITALASVKTTLTKANKTLVTGKTVSNVNSPKGLSTGETISLGVSDVIEITSIVGGDANSPEETIVLDDFILDNGQREDSYKNATLTYIGDATLDCNVTITLNHFTHGSGDYFNRDSYPVSFDYAKIPTYKGIRLSDAFDFRGSAGAELDPNTGIDTIVDYYLPRYDLLVVTRRGEFLLQKGVSSTAPSIPPKPKGSMVLYSLYLPAFTFNAKSIQKEYVEHRRYTMKDIGKLEKRLQNLEYYTSLSLLERNAKDKDIFDTAGERFKNGIFVDSFTGHNRSDVKDPKHKCAIDRANGQLRPGISINQVEVKINTATTDKLVRLPSVAEETIIEQKYASVSESVIPYHISASYNGTLQLSPTSDDWVETRRRPDLTENPDNNYDNISRGSDGATIFASEFPQSSVEILGAVDAQDSETVEEAYDEWGGMWVTHNGMTWSNDEVDLDDWWPGEEDQVRTTSTNNFNGDTGTHESAQKIAKTKKTPVTILPSIRSRRVYFRATGMKPNTRLYTYLDDVNITAYTTTLSSGSYSDYLNHNLALSARLDFYGMNSLQAMTQASDTHRNVVTDDNGMAEGFLIIPNTNAVHFPVGKRIVTFSDTNGGRNDGNITSRCRSSYTVSSGNNNIDPVDGNTQIIPLGPQDSDIGPGPAKVIQGDEGDYTVAIAGTGVAEYNLTVDNDQIEEGGTFTVTLKTENVDDGNVAYTITGAILSDFSGEAALTGNLALVDGVATKKFSVRIDNVTDEMDIINFALNVDPASYYVDITVDDVVVENEEGETRFLSSDDNLNNEFCREDPLAQSFHLADAKIPRGAYIKSLDLYFETKTSANDPVRVQIVEVENGIPTSRIVKGGVKDLNPGSVNISSDSSEKTTFTFDNPVYLDSEREYAFVVRSTSKDYQVWMSELGQVDKVTGAQIMRDPYLGVAFRSANASTWTPVQTRDIKFRLNAHTFMTSTESSRTRSVGAGTETETGTGAFQSLIGTSFTAASVQFKPGQTIHPKTSINYRLVAGTKTLNLSPTGNHNYLGSAVSVTSASNLRLVAHLTTEDRYLTPTIDLEKLSLICYGNVINNVDTDETDAAHGLSTARYVSKKVILNDPADKLNVFVGVNRPKGSNVQVYARFDDEISSPQVLDCKDSDWTELNSNSIPESLSGYDEDDIQFDEIDYEIDPTNDFSQFQLKIVMTSADSSKVPIVNDLRAIATV